MPARGIILFASALGCASPTPVHVRAQFSEDAPLADLEIVALPFNPGALLDSLAAAAAVPRPAFRGLEQRVLQYRPPATKDEPAGKDARSIAAGIASRATRDSVLRLSAAMRRMDRTAPGYRETHARFRDLYSRYSAREAARETELRKGQSIDRTLANEATRAADSLRAWERNAYREFPRLARERAAALGRAPIKVTTDSMGRATLGLASGTWWLTARLPDPVNPFAEYHWDVALVASGLPFGVPVSLANAEAQWRH